MQNRTEGGDGREPRAPFVPPYDIARAVARRALSEAAGLEVNAAPAAAVYASWGGLRAALEMLLGALDADDEQAAAQQSDDARFPAIERAGRGQADVGVDHGQAMSVVEEVVRQTAAEYADCPRCRHKMDLPGRSRATSDRDVEICGPCCSDEATREAAGLPWPAVSEWPVTRPGATR